MTLHPSHHHTRQPSPLPPPASSHHGQRGERHAETVLHRRPARLLGHRGARVPDERPREVQQGAVRLRVGGAGVPQAQRQARARCHVTVHLAGGRRGGESRDGTAERAELVVGSHDVIFRHPLSMIRD